MVLRDLPLKVGARFGAVLLARTRRLDRLATPNQGTRKADVLRSYDADSAARSRRVDLAGGAGRARHVRDDRRDERERARRRARRDRQRGRAPPARLSHAGSRTATTRSPTRRATCTTSARTATWGSTSTRPAARRPRGRRGRGRCARTSCGSSTRRKGGGRSTASGSRHSITDKNFLDNAQRLDVTGRLLEARLRLAGRDGADAHLCYRPTLDQDSIGSSTLNYYAGATLTRADAVRLPLGAVVLGLQRAARRVPGVSARDRHRPRRVGDAKHRAADAAPARLHARARAHARRAGGAVLRVRRCATRQAARRRSGASGSAIVSALLQQTRTDNPVEPTRGYNAALELRGSAQRSSASDTALTFPQRDVGPVVVLSRPAADDADARVRAGTSPAEPRSTGGAPAAAAAGAALRRRRGRAFAALGRTSSDRSSTCSISRRSRSSPPSRARRYGLTVRREPGRELAAADPGRRQFAGGAERRASASRSVLSRAFRVHAVRRRRAGVDARISQ